jgi:hypothetical protein
MPNPLSCAIAPAYTSNKSSRKRGLALVPTLANAGSGQFMVTAVILGRRWKVRKRSSDTVTKASHLDAMSASRPSTILNRRPKRTGMNAMAYLSKLSKVNFERKQTLNKKQGIKVSKSQAWTALGLSATRYAKTQAQNTG